MQLRRVMISGGGTGGHVFPAIAIADALKEANPEIEIHFVGAKGKMEMEKVPAAGYSITGLWISGFQRKLSWSNLLFPIKLLSSLWKSRKLLEKFKPDVVVGVGGYASGPLLKIASSRNIPTLLQEQNSYPGLTNRLLAKHASRIAVAYPNMEKFFPKEKIAFTGNPTRKTATDITGKKESALKTFKLKSDAPIVLAIGGSLGARTINESIKNALELFNQKNFQVIWQTGKFYINDTKDFMSKNNFKNVYYNDFIKTMDLAYAAADIIISRAGAISVSELCIVAKPSILIPSPNVADDHQTKNAKSLVENNACVLLKDNEAINNLGETVIRLWADKEKCNELSQNIHKMAAPEAAQKIVDEIKKIAKN